MSLIGREFYESALRMLARTEYAVESPGDADVVRHLWTAYAPEPDEDRDEPAPRRMAR